MPFLREDADGNLTFTGLNECVWLRDDNIRSYTSTCAYEKLDFTHVVNYRILHDRAGPIVMRQQTSVKKNSVITDNIPLSYQNILAKACNKYSSPPNEETESCLYDTYTSKTCTPTISSRVGAAVFDIELSEKTEYDSCKTAFNDTTGYSQLTDSDSGTTPKSVIYPVGYTDWGSFETKRYFEDNMNSLFDFKISARAHIYWYADDGDHFLQTDWVCLNCGIGLIKQQAKTNTKKNNSNNETPSDPIYSPSTPPVAF